MKANDDAAIRPATREFDNVRAGEDQPFPGDEARALDVVLRVKNGDDGGFESGH